MSKRGSSTLSSYSLQLYSSFLLSHSSSYYFRLLTPSSYPFSPSSFLPLTFSSSSHLLLKREAQDQDCNALLLALCEAAFDDDSTLSQSAREARLSQNLNPVRPVESGQKHHWFLPSLENEDVFISEEEQEQLDLLVPGGAGQRFVLKSNPKSGTTSSYSTIPGTTGTRRSSSSPVSSSSSSSSSSSTPTKLASSSQRVLEVHFLPFLLFSLLFFLSLSQAVYPKFLIQSISLHLEFDGFRRHLCRSTRTGSCS
jgi:hypothetical protein